MAQCWTCHRAYEPINKIVEMSKKYPDYAVTAEDFDETTFQLKNQESEHGAKTLPPDYTWHEVRSASSVEELYVRLAAGVGGTSMPSWQGTISNSDIWAVSYYVKSLMDLKNTEQRKAVIENK